MAATLRKNLLKKGMIVTRNIALSSEAAVIDHDFDFLKMVLNNTISQDEEAIYGIITDTDGNIFVHTAELKKHKILSGEHAEKAIEIKEPTFFELTYKNKPVMEIAVPIYIRKIKWGVIRIGFTMKLLNFELNSAEKRLSKKINVSLVNNISMTTLFLIVGILAAHFIGGRIASPIKKLTNSAKKISSGNMDQRVHIKEKGEIGELADSFNYMAETLKKRELEISKNYKELRGAYAKLDEYKKKLEEKVGKRAEELKSAYNKLKIIQEEVLNTERLSVVGEMSGRIAHEILNPMTSIQAKVELKIEAQNKNLLRLGHIMEIINDWEAELKNNNFQNYASQVVVDKTTKEEKTYIEDDIQIIKIITSQIEKEHKNNRKDMTFILRNFKRIVKIVDELRGMSRRVGSIENININIPIKEALEILSHSIEKRGIDLDCSFAGTLPFVRADFNELVQIFSNVIKNASQAISEKDGPDKKISISTNFTEERVEVRITDTGIGISEEDSFKIFNIGFTRKSRKEGTGLGLNISQRLIRKYKGDIEMEKTKPGKITTFLIYLPIPVYLPTVVKENKA